MFIVVSVDNLPKYGISVIIWTDDSVDRTMILWENGVVWI